MPRPIPTWRIAEGLLAISPDASDSLVGRLASLPPETLASAITMIRAPALPAASEAGYDTSADGVALIRIEGILTKYPSIWSLLSGSRPMSMLAEDVRRAARDPNVRSIMLLVDSPGGTTAGTGDLALEVFRARRSKPVWAYISDMAASAAYWIASQADRVVGNAQAAAGSIGTYAVVADFSEIAAKEGIKVHVIRSGTFKGAGEPGTAITPEHLAEFQRRINSITEGFVSDVARGRGWPPAKAEAMADGRLWIGREAVAQGLIDNLSTLDEALALLAGRASSAPISASQARTENLMNPKLLAYLKAIGLKADATDADALAFSAKLDGIQKETAAALTAPPPIPAAPPAPAPAPAAAAPIVSPPDPAAMAREATLAERKRIEEISGVAKTLKMDETWAGEMVRGGFSADQARAEAVKKMEARLAPVAIGAARIEVGSDLNRDTLPAAVADALVLRAGGRLFEHEPRERGYRVIRDAAGKPKAREAHARAGDFRHMRLLEMGRAFLTAQGIPQAGSIPVGELAAMLLNPRILRQRYGEAMAAGGQSTSDFAHILASTVNRTLRARYIESTPTWQAWCRRATAPDFRTIARTQLSEVGNLALRAEGADIAFTTLTDSHETYALAEYAGGIALTSRVIINDDLDFLSRLPQAEMDACVRVEDDVGYAILTVNAALHDTVALFSVATHANLAGTPAALTVASLGIGRTAMAIQRGPKGQAYLNLVPRSLIVPPDIATVAEQLINSLVDPAAAALATLVPMPKYIKNLQLVVEPRLHTASTTAWYLACDPNQCDTVEVCFLDGSEGPEITEETDFSSDTLRIKMVHRVAAKAMDFRGLFMNAGA